MGAVKSARSGKGGKDSATERGAGDRRESTLEENLYRYLDRSVADLGRKQLFHFLPGTNLCWRSGPPSKIRS